MTEGTDFKGACNVCILFLLTASADITGYNTGKYTEKQIIEANTEQKYRKTKILYITEDVCKAIDEGKH